MVLLWIETQIRRFCGLYRSHYTDWVGNFRFSFSRDVCYCVCVRVRACVLFRVRRYFPFSRLRFLDSKKIGI